MFYNLLSNYAQGSHLANLFSYITFRSAIAFIVSFSLCLLLTPLLIRYLRHKHVEGQPIRDDGPETHFAKVGTPTMGGVVIIISTIIASLLFVDLSNIYGWCVIGAMFLFGCLGFIDDYSKISKGNYRGISAKFKLLFQCLASILIILVIYSVAREEYSTHIMIPFFKRYIIDLSFFYFPFAMFVIIGSSNAVNLTDGLDGLAIGTTAIAACSFTVITYLVGNAIYADYLNLIFVPRSGEVTIICAAIIGSAVGFLWYNCRPAEIFMGDTGSLALGGTLGTISLIIKHEIVLAIIGGVFVIETLSVIIQVYYFKISGGKRFFLMAPIHHHFERKGWPESKVVIRFWIIAIMFSLIGLATLKLR